MVAVYDRALSAEEVGNNFTAGKDGDQAPDTVLRSVVLVNNGSFIWMSDAAVQADLTQRARPPDPIRWSGCSQRLPVHTGYFRENQ